MTIPQHQHVLTPGLYVGAEAIEDDDEPLDEKVARLAQEIRDGFTKRTELQGRVLAALDRLKTSQDV